MPMTLPEDRQRAAYALWTKISIRFSDQDPQGHVNNAAYASYTETVRVDFFRRIAAVVGDPSQGFTLGHIAIDYLKELTYPGEIDAGIRLIKLGTKSITTRSGMFIGDVCVATATAVNVCFDVHTRQSRPMDALTRTAFEKYL
jgi:acyl-CoA thioester hydrolase